MTRSSPPIQAKYPRHQGLHAGRPHLYMDVAPQGAATGYIPCCCCTATTSGGFYSRPASMALTAAGFRVIVPDQIGYGKSSKPIAPTTQLAGAQHVPDPAEGEGRAGDADWPLDGGMLAARIATQYSKAVERLVIYNPIGLTDGRFDRPMTPIDGALPADAEDRLPEHPHRPEPLRGAITGGGTRSSRPTRASAIRGRSAPTGRDWRWCRP